MRLGSDEMLVRCLRCQGTPVHLSLIAAIRAHLPALARLDAYELSTRGAVHAFLKAHCASLASSEFLPDTPPGEAQEGIRNEDVQRLTFKDASFDLCTSTEVFEHVPDDIAGFRELARVLRPGGWICLTVPVSAGPTTVQRAHLTPGGIEHILPPSYHGDRLTGADTVLVYRDYGLDIVDRVKCSGFSIARLWSPPVDFFGHARRVLVARR
ncbi:MAG TPA: class I SAM-dependent methyltransferase [Luteimonas sp.]|nr:class I SAM-dependent methyltransferase [Luteimonas sp.]